MTIEQRNAKITSIISGMKIGEVKCFKSGAEVHCDAYTQWGYSVVSPDGDTSVDRISKSAAADLVISGY